MANRGRPRKPAAQPTPDEAERREWWLRQLARIQTSVEKTEPEADGFGKLLVNAGICESKLKDLRGKGGPPPAPKVAQRPPTKFDKKGPPKK
jgi:hypothetical protein